ncbi:hypothetical protein Dimus_028362 [Dionaea muscipula]
MKLPRSKYSYSIISRLLIKPIAFVLDDHDHLVQLSRPRLFQLRRRQYYSAPRIDDGAAYPSILKPISAWPGVYDSPATNMLWQVTSSIFKRTAATQGEATKHVIRKTPGESQVSVEYRFSSDYLLREQYRNCWHEIRMGKLIEELDALAGAISYKVYALHAQ